MADTSSQFISVHTLANRFEADVIMEALRQEGIPALLRSFEETAYTGLFVPQKGWGRIMVPKEMAAQAREVISALAGDDAFDDPADADTREIDPRLWEALREADPRKISQSGAVEYDPEEHIYVIPFLNTVVLCYPEAEEIEVIGQLADLSNDFQLTLVTLHYLLGARKLPLSNKWVSEKDLPSGHLFFTKTHSLPLESLADSFDPRPELFDAAARAIGGEKANLGDLSYQFRILPRIPILVILWRGDDEFEASSHILFDNTITEHLASLDLVWGLVNVLTRVLIQCAGFSPESGQP